ncbi:ataxin-7-like protein 1 isoform X3 [Ceratina calcarata]|uniref:Ataxin-7-like protein 1 isoform X3 n=1 Tax=Ceratina calcarata TaxID=156304 RepID=A0AAJ7RYQ9_9HYME|nr:ataxin-7-like protein 1 isoform X3 [Ceratina calcarata]
MSGSDSPTFFHGQPWSNWIERIGRDKPLSDEESEAQLSSSVTRLASEDIDLYGFCPERDTFYTVVCETCHAIVKPQALIQHMESRHPSGTVNFPPPSTPVVKPPLKTPYCKVSKLKKTQPSPQISTSGNSSKINHTNVKRSNEQPSISTSLSSTPVPISSSPRSPLESLSSSTSNSGSTVASSPVKSPGTGQPRRKRLKTDRSLLKDREYDPDKHCGVWNDETGKPCTRSLTCKAHTVSLRRTVVGRSKTFDKLLAEHRASKEVPSRPKVIMTGTLTVSSAPSILNPLTPTTPVLTIETEAPSSPPVLSLPDTYPLPKAVDLLYRCLAPHGSTKPTKLEEDFANEELRSLESSLVNSTGTSQSSSMMAPIPVVLPSLSPLPANNDESSSSIATLIPSTASPAIPVPATLPATCTQPSLVTTVLEAETPIDIDPEAAMTIYSPVYKDKSKLVLQLPRSNNIAHSPISSMPSLIFEPIEQFEQLEQLEQQHVTQINGKRLNHATARSSPIAQRQSKRTKHREYHQQDLSTAIQVEATTTSSPYPHFGDISWSNCHPEPLAVSRWLRISSSRKQYNFNIH